MVITQYSIKKGMKLCGTHGGSAKTDELLQLHMRNVLGSKLPSEMTNMEIKDALCYLVFLKQNECGRIKKREFVLMAAPYEFINDMLENCKLIWKVILTFRLAVICSVSNLKVQNLDEKQTILFRHFVAKALLLCKQAQTDLQTAMAKAPDNDGYKKLCMTV